MRTLFRGLHHLLFIMSFPAQPTIMIHRGGHSRPQQWRHVNIYSSDEFSPKTPYYAPPRAYAVVTEGRHFLQIELRLQTTWAATLFIPPAKTPTLTGPCATTTPQSHKCAFQTQGDPLQDDRYNKFRWDFDSGMRGGLLIGHLGCL